MTDEQQDPLNEPSAYDPHIEIDVVTPEGFPARITFTSATVKGLIKKTRFMTESLLAAKWQPGNAPSAASTMNLPAPPGNMPLFAGFPCSEVIDATGRPKWIWDHDGSQAHLRMYSGGDWGYTYPTGETSAEGKKEFKEVIKFKAADPIPAVKYPEETE